MMNFVKNPVRSAVLIAAGLVGLIVLMSTWYTIDSGDRGVILRNGKIVGTAAPGLHFKVPIIDQVQTISVREFSKVYEGLPAYSRDQQTATLVVSVTFAVPDGAADKVYETYGNIQNMVNNLLDRQVNEKLRNVFGRFNAASAVQDRERLTGEFREAVMNAVEGPIEIRDVQIENIDFSDAYEESIEQRMLAEVAVQKIRQDAERERVSAEIKVIQAEAEANADRERKEAEADGIRMLGQAEAEAIDVRGRALRDNPALIELVTAERWNGVLPQSMIPGGAVPFINLGATNEAPGSDGSASASPRVTIGN